MTSWLEFSSEAPELADAVRSRFEANVHHVIATIRGSGAPRLSGTEVRVDDEVRVGIMPGAARLHDLHDDARVEIHSAPLEPNLEQGDARLGGRLEPANGVDFTLDITRVTLVRVVEDELVHQIWKPGVGIRESRRR